MTRTAIALAAIVGAVSISAAGQSRPVSAALGSASASAAPSASSDTPSAALHQRYPRYQLQKGDSFEIDMPFSPEFNQTVAVQPDGFVTLKGVGSVHVEGQTVPQLTGTLKTAYAGILHDPVITIALKDFEKPYFIAAGEVKRPGKYELRTPLTVTEAVAVAGGFDDRSKHSRVVLYRPAPGGGFDAKVLNIKKLLASRNLSEDLVLKPGDMVYVPQNAYSKVRPYIPTPNAGVGAYYNAVPY
jgi:polysaccharide export outer membrane protein